MRTPRILGIDAGGTMTDTFVIDDSGRFIVGKALTTPEDESIGFVNSARDALSYWNIEAELAFPQLSTGIYSGTAMLNRLLERKGRNVGVIVTAGMEDYFRLERGIQTYLGYSYADRLHVATHVHNTPIVPRQFIKGVRERIDLFGQEVIPLYTDEVESAVLDLLELNVESICICLLYAYRNPAHELDVQMIAERVMGEMGKTVPLFVSSDLYPIRGDFPRLNTIVVEAYAADPSRAQLQRVSQACQDLGGNFDLRIMASHGGAISIEARQLARTLISGPIGGVIGARYLAEHIGSSNMICTDVGGTSFDLAVITEGQYAIKPNPDMARFVLAIPLVQMNSVGAGTGSFARINPNSNRLEIGPDSAGARIGVCYPEGGVDTVTVTDCAVILGLVNPDNFLGGKVRLDRKRALQAVQEQIAIPLKLDVMDAARGVVEMLEETLKNQVVAMILGKGYAPVNFSLISYGGGGPLHVAGYTDGLDFQDILIPAWAAGFSAYGCSCSDFEYRYDAQIDVPFSLSMSEDELSGLADLINGQWAFLREKIVAEFAKSGYSEEHLTFNTGLRIQYAGQLNDIEVQAPAEWLAGAGDLCRVVTSFEDLYGRVYASSAKSPELGYLITTVLIRAAAPTTKPELPQEGRHDPVPLEEACIGQRDVCWRDGSHCTSIYSMEALLPGNIVCGPAIIESPATTLPVPPGKQVRLDQHRIFHLSSVGM